MADLIVLNSSLTVTITLQIFQPDSFLPFMDELIKKGFMVNQPKYIQQTQVETGPLARKGTITNLQIDYITRRIFIQITNNIKSPQDDLTEILSVLYSIGYNSDEFIERINIEGIIILKTNDSNSNFINNVVKDEFKEKVNQIFNTKTDMAAIRIASEEPMTGDISKSPFLILIEPLLSDLSKTKFQIHVMYANSDSKNTVLFMQNLYDRLKNVLSVFKDE